MLIVLIFLKGRRCITRCCYLWTQWDCWKFDIRWSRY